MSLRDPKEPTPLGIVSSIMIHINWPGYPPFDHMILVRTQTPARNPMTLKRFLQHVGRKVQRFLADCERVPCDPHSKWIAGPNHITPDEVILIDVVQVSTTASDSEAVTFLCSFLIVVGPVVSGTNRTKYHHQINELRRAVGGTIE